MRTDVGTVEDLHASAVKACGLDDFGGDDDNYIEALTVLLDAYRTEADLTEFGSKMQRFFARNALVARLVSEAAFTQYPQHVDVAIERPIFVTGLPRTGTTAVHRLLAADPRHQGLQLWLAEFPQPRPPRDDQPSGRTDPGASRKDGAPRISISSASTSITSCERKRRATRIASASRVYSSTTHSMRIFLLSCVRCSTKSYAQT